MEPRSPLLSGRRPAPPRGAGRLLALELSFPLAEECPDPFLRVLGLEGSGKALRLGLKTLVEVAIRGDLFDLLDRDRRLVRQLPRPRQRRVEELVVGYDLV